MGSLLYQPEICWLWRNPNPSSRKVHRVVIYGSITHTCRLDSMFIYEQAKSGKVVRGDTRDLTCEICRKAADKKPATRMQLLAFTRKPAQLRSLAFDFRKTLTDDVDATAEDQRQTGLVMADYLEEKGLTEEATIIRLICCESRDWGVLERSSQAVQDILAKRKAAKERCRHIEKERLTRFQPRGASWLVWKPTVTEAKS